MRQKRLIYLDTAKGIGIIAVMLGHSCGIPVILPIVTGFYMALFFIIAGMTTKEEDFLNERGYIPRRLRRKKLFE